MQRLFTPDFIRAMLDPWIAREGAERVYERLVLMAAHPELRDVEMDDMIDSALHYVREAIAERRGK